ncbi:MAG: MFS transporter [Nocardioidaceae bacterium]
MQRRSGLVPRLPRDAWVVLGGDALSAVGSGLTLPFLLVYLSRIRDIDLVTAGLAVSTVALAGFAGNPFGGWLTDRWGSRWSLVCGLTLAAAGAFLIAGVRSPWQAFVAVSVAGFGVAIVVPSQDSLLAVVVEPRHRSAVFAVRNATLNAGYGIGAVLASLIVDLTSSASFVLLYVVDGLTFLVFVPVLWLLLPGAGARPADLGRPSQAQATSGYALVLRDRTFLRTWVLIALLVTVGFSQTLAAFPVFATADGGISAAALSIAFAINTVIVVVAQLPVLRLMDGHRRTTGIVVACLLWAAAWAVTFLAGQFDGVSAVAGFCLALGVFGVGETFLAPSQAALVNDLAPDDLRGRYNGLYTLAWTAGFLVGPAVAASALAAGRAGLLFAGLILACGIAALGAVRLRSHLPAGTDLVSMQTSDDRIS